MTVVPNWNPVPVNFTVVPPPVDPMAGSIALTASGPVVNPVVVSSKSRVLDVSR